MSQNRTLNIEITRDRHNKPLAIVKNFPGLDAEMYSDNLRKMAAQLIQAADDLDALNSEQAQAISHAQTKPTRHYREACQQAKTNQAKNNRVGLDLRPIVSDSERAQIKQTNKPNIDFSHRVPFSVKKGDSFALYHALYPILQRAAAVADLIEVACEAVDKADFAPDTLWRGAQAVRFEIKDAQSLLDAYYPARKAEVLP